MVIGDCGCPVAKMVTVDDSFTYSSFFRGQKPHALIEFLVGSLSVSIMLIIRYKEFPWDKISNKIMNKSLGLIPDGETNVPFKS